MIIMIIMIEIIIIAMIIIITTKHIMKIIKHSTDAVAFRQDLRRQKQNNSIRKAPNKKASERAADGLQAFGAQTSTGLRGTPGLNHPEATENLEHRSAAASPSQRQMY